MSYIHLDEQSVNALLERNGAPAKITVKPKGRLYVALTKADGLHWLIKLFKALHMTTVEFSMTGGKNDIRFTIYGALWACVPNIMIRPWLPSWLTIVEHSQVKLDLYAHPSEEIREILTYVEVTRAAVPGEDGAALTIFFKGTEG